MSRRTYSPNALEPVLASGMTAGSTTVPLDSATGLTAPGYMVIDPDNVAKREFFKFESINSDALETLTRGLTGSAGGAVAHDSGAVVRTVMTSQALDDLFLDVIDLETDQHTEAHTVASHSDTTGTGAELETLTDGSNADSLHLHSELIVFGETGDLTVKTGTHRFYLPYGVKIIEVEISVGTAPTGAAAIVDVHVDGVTIFTTPSNRPEIAISGFVDSSVTIEDDTHTDGQYVTVDIDQIGSTIAGADLTVVIRWEKV